MKHGKKPTVAQRRILKSWGLSCPNWMVVKDTPEVLVIVHRYSGESRVIPKQDKIGRDT